MFRGHFLTASLLLFLFAGLYKPYVPSPVDITIVACLLTLIGIAINSPVVPIGARPLLCAIAMLMWWTAFRLTPELSPFGVRKFSESILFGLPALIGGLIVVRNYPKLFAKWLIWVGVPLAIILLLSSKGRFNAIGESYQLTGLFFALAMIATAVAGRWYMSALFFIAVAMTGNLSGLLFGVVAAAAALFAAGKGRRIVLGSVALVCGVMIYGSLWGMPPGVNRVLPKIETVFLVDFDKVEMALAGLSELRTYDRPQLFYAGWLRFLEAPIAGHGFGNADYAFDVYPHNMALELAAETGILGLALFLGILTMAFFAAAKSPFVLGVLVLVVMTSMVSGYWGGRIFFFALGMAAGAYGQPALGGYSARCGSRVCFVAMDSQNKLTA